MITIIFLQKKDVKNPTKINIMIVLKLREFAKYITSSNTSKLNAYNKTRLFNTDFTFVVDEHLVINLFNANLLNNFGN